MSINQPLPTGIKRIAGLSLILAMLMMGKVGLMWVVGMMFVISCFGLVKTKKWGLSIFIAASVITIIVWGLDLASNETLMKVKQVAVRVNWDPTMVVSIFVGLRVVALAGLIYSIVYLRRTETKKWFSQQFQ